MGFFGTLFTFGAGVVTGVWLEQHYRMPAVDDYLNVARGWLDRFKEERKRDADKE